MTFEDLKGCLILLSYDTVRPRMKARHGTMCCPLRLKTMATFLCRRSSRSNAQTAAWQESRSFIICSDSKIFGKYTISPENSMWMNSLIILFALSPLNNYEL